MRSMNYREQTKLEALKHYLFRSDINGTTGHIRFRPFDNNSGRDGSSSGSGDSGARMGYNYRRGDSGEFWYSDR